MTAEINTPDEIVSDLIRSLGLDGKEKQRRYTLKDKVVAAFLYMFYEELTEDGTTRHRFTQSEIADFMGLDEDHFCTLMKNDSVLSIAACVVEYCKQFEKWFAALKVGNVMNNEIKDYTDKWLSALKRGTKK